MEEIIKLLAQIVEQTKPDNSALWIAITTSVSTLLGASIGALLLLKGTQKQVDANTAMEEKKLKAEIITRERLRWLQDLRKVGSEFYANLDMNYSLIKRPVKDYEIQSNADDIAQNVMVQCNQIITLLNPDKPEQKSLRISCSNALAFFQECVAERNKGNLNYDDSKYAVIKNEFFSSLTEIGAKTWGKIKKLE